MRKRYTIGNIDGIIGINISVVLAPVSLVLLGAGLMGMKDVNK